MARHVWSDMKATDSRECRHCHAFSQMSPSKHNPAVVKRHALAQEQGKTCIDCYMDIAHRMPDEFIDNGHMEYIEQERECTHCHVEM